MNLAGETEVLGGNLPRRHFVHHKIPHDPRSNPGRRGGKPATNRLSYGAAGEDGSCLRPRGHCDRLHSRIYEKVKLKHNYHGKI
jgi:hypothetical protein